MIKDTYQGLKHNPLLFINASIEGVLGLLMIFAPSSIQIIGSVEIPLSLIQTCGLLAISVAAFSKLGAKLVEQSKNKSPIRQFVYTNLAVFNTALTIGLTLSALRGDINYLGMLIHLPLAIVFIVMAFKYSSSRAG